MLFTTFWANDRKKFQQKKRIYYFLSLKTGKSRDSTGCRHGAHEALGWLFAYVMGKAITGRQSNPSGNSLLEFLLNILILWLAAGNKPERKTRDKNQPL
jgi:hypothetical protein